MNIVDLSPLQQVIDDLTKEKSEMEERLVDTEQRLNEFEETGQKFLHLQVKLQTSHNRSKNMEQSYIKSYFTHEPHREKIGFLPMRKQRRRSASR